MPTISLCMIVKNESEVIERCLKSVQKLVDEIIIVDTGSTDNTKEICRKYTRKIFDFEWINDFSQARNFSFSKATCDYIMWLDADDVIPKSSLKKLLNLKLHLTSDTYMLNYITGFVENRPTFSFYRERIMKNCPLAKWEGCVHECITPFGKVEKLNITIEHRKIKASDPNRNIKIYSHILKDRPLNTRELYYYGRELFDHSHYKKCIKILKNFIAQNDAWVENIIDALYIISVCFHQLKLYELELEYLFSTFSYSPPRSKICCKIGDYFILKNQYNLSIYWYLLAITNKKMSNNGGFVEKIYFDYYPYMQLCFAYFKIGNIEKSEKYNLKAHKIMPTADTKNNLKFFLQYHKSKA